MELVAASKMRRAVASVLRTRPYAETAWKSVRAALSAAPKEMQHFFLTGNPEAKKTLIVLFTSDRGLAGGFNVNMTKAMLSYLREHRNEEIEIVGVGRRGADAVERAGAKVIARFPALTNNPAYQDLLPVARIALDGFKNGEYKNVILGYTDFISGITQKPRVYELLPFKMTPEEEADVKGELKFEPSAEKVFERVLPALAKTMIWQSLLESAASEHAARMLAMKNASDSAGDMLTALTFTYNQARQASITQEIAEISSGKAALE